MPCGAWRLPLRSDLQRRCSARSYLCADLVSRFRSSHILAALSDANFGFAALAGELANCHTGIAEDSDMDRAGQISLLKTLLHYVDTKTTSMADAPWRNEVSAYTCPERHKREEEILIR